METFTGLTPAYVEGYRAGVRAVQLEELGVEPPELDAIEQDMKSRPTAVLQTERDWWLGYYQGRAAARNRP